MGVQPRGLFSGINSMDIVIAERPTLRGERVLLRSPRPDDTADRLRCGRDMEFRRMVGGDTRTNPPFTAAEAEEWCGKIAADPLRWVIEFAGRAIGGLHLHSLDETDRRARFVIGIFDAACWEQGLGTEATQLLLAHAFDGLGLHRVDLRVLDFNHRAIACYEKCGFVREGIEREGALIAGEWQTDVFMSILEQEYRDLR